MDERLPLFEGIATSLEDALLIEEGGGQRIELVSALSEGGFTPSLGLVKAVLEKVRIPVAVMIRPNRRDFYYSPQDKEEMKRDARLFWSAGVRHVVLGLLDEEGIADVDGIEEILEGTGLQATFHRAIDESSDIGRSLDRINACHRVSHILTSLGRGQVIDNLDRLPFYRGRARPRLILASGISHKNAAVLGRAANQFGTDIHVGTALRHMDPMRPVDPFLVRTMADILHPEGKPRPVPQKEEALAAFRLARYGLFIHFGLYSMLGGNYLGRETPFLAEWIRLSLDIEDEAYRSLADSFDPVDFDPDEICRRAKAWGMAYVCLTAKHHDGFALFDSKADSFNLTARSPSGRDLVEELSRACQREGLLFCLYYSQAQDWDHPGGIKAYRDLPDREAFQDYFQGKCLPQLRELLTRYGPLAMLWLDTPLGMELEDSLAIRDLVRDLQPTCLISGRIGWQLGDYVSTGDNRLPRLSQRRLWEAPLTLNRNWGYRASDQDWKRPSDLIRLMTLATSRGGNLLVNVGPDGTGEIPLPSLDILDQAGAFLGHYGRAYEGAFPVPEYPYENDDFLLTATPTGLYIHLLSFPDRGRLELFHIGHQPAGIRLMADGSPVQVLIGRDLEGYPYWRLDLVDKEELIREEIQLWGEAILEVDLASSPLAIVDF